MISFNIYKCKRESQLLLVEGLPDAAYLPSLGIQNIVATGQGDLSSKHLESLKIYEIESVVIIFDNDSKDSKGEIGSIEKAKKASDILKQMESKHLFFLLICSVHLRIRMNTSKPMV